jgi:hypothetical protein
MSTPTLDILKTAESGKAEELWQELRNLADSSLYYFTKVVMNFRDMTEGFHRVFCERMDEDDDPELGIQDAGYLLARAHFKSTVNKCRLLRKYLRNHEERFLIIGESDTVAKSKLIDIRWHILNNKFLQWLYPELKSVDPGNTKWTDAEILLPREGTYDEPTFTCDGIGAKRTGFHYTEITFEDVIGDKAAASQAVMDSAWDWIEYSRGLLHDPAKSRRRFIGTRWKHGEGDVYGKAMVAMPQCRWYVRSAIEHGVPVFPERFSLATLASIRQEEGEYKFNCQYMNDPTAPGGADFEVSWIKEYDVDPDDHTMIIPCDGSPKIQTGSLLRMSFYDVSSGGKTANCENAIEVAGMAADRRIFVLEDFGENCSIGHAVETWHVMNDRWRCYKNHYELVGAQKAIEDFCQERKSGGPCPYCKAGHLIDGKYIRNPHRKISPIGIKPEGGGMNKEERIRMYAQKAFEEGRVYIRRGMTKLRSQIVQFPHSDLVDRFDALAYLIKLLRPPLSDADVDSARAFEARRKQQGHPRIATGVDYGGYA